MSDVLLAREGAVATLTLNRPDRRNALGPGLMGDLAAHVDALEADPTVRVVVITGAGSAFSAGADIEWMRASRDLSVAENREDAVALRVAFERVDRCAKAVIAQVQGPAIGGGAGLVACADVAVASTDARFAFAEVRLGLIPATIAPYVLRAVGPGHTRELFTSGRSFDADEARRLGLVHDVTSPDDLDAAVAARAAAFLACGPEAVAAAKALVRDATASLDLADLSERIATARAGAEAQEGLAAFLEKRPPGWSGSTGS